jgi:hypothetical protein
MPGSRQDAFTSESKITCGISQARNVCRIAYYPRQQRAIQCLQRFTADTLISFTSESRFVTSERRFRHLRELNSSLPRAVSFTSECPYIEARDSSDSRVQVNSRSRSLCKMWISTAHALAPMQNRTSNLATVSLRSALQGEAKTNNNNCKYFL